MQGGTNFRFHDTRHTAAIRIMRASNLRVAQKLLGHSDIKTTTKYAHAMMEDVRSALDAMSATETATDYTTEDIKILKTRRIRSLEPPSPVKCATGLRYAPSRKKP
ncbi:tyrosine-type recombinase/integrase [Brucella pituitosa]|uniref:Tyrosine-type recombinase/integrase n=1 Tax=Brucella pituitosa TaxID=571256 RepID=A0ABS3JWP0_9HYPH|nr:tyrosine-type recombinase/integrase [Brucella pituitosa]MBO1039085.1 tyrosine-type recombinase/integrase [Brucella pituitosa]